MKNFIKMTALLAVLTISYQANAWQSSQIGTINNSITSKSGTSAYSVSSGNGISASYGETSAYGRVSGQVKPVGHSGLSASTSVLTGNYSKASNFSLGSATGGALAGSWTSGDVRVDGHRRNHGSDVRVTLKNDSQNDTFVEVGRNDRGSAISFTQGSNRFYGNVHFSRYGDTKIMKSNDKVSTFTATHNGEAWASGNTFQKSKVSAHKRVFTFGNR